MGFRLLIMVLIWIETPKSILPWWLETKLTQFPEMPVLLDENLFPSDIKLYHPLKLKAFLPLVCWYIRQKHTFSWISSNLCLFQYSFCVTVVLRCTGSFAVYPHYKYTCYRVSACTAGVVTHVAYLFSIFLTYSDSKVTQFLLFHLISNSLHNIANGLL